MTAEALALSVAMSVAAGLIGCFAVMRRMAITADPLSHVALPGIGIALALHIHPLLGAAAMLLFGAVLVWAVEETSRATTETAIGVVFSAAFAIGGMITSGEDLIDSLFGGGGAPGWQETVGGLLVATMIVGFVLAQRHQLVIMLVSPDIARTAGVNVRRVNLLYLLAFALTLALGLRYMGVLLMAALIITPPATAIRLARNLTSTFVIAVTVAVCCTLLGAWIATTSGRETGPVIVVVAAAVFLVSLLYRRR